MSGFEKRIEEVRQILSESTGVLIGAGAGLSAAAGIDYSGPGFRKEFADFISRYGFTDLYTSSFYDFPSEEERWAYWAKHIDFARLEPDGLPLYRELFDLVVDKEYFVITTNVDGQFSKAGFSPDRLFEMQGDYAYIQCSRGCHPKRYYSGDLVRKMVASIKDCRIPSELVPSCPVCNGRMDINIRKDQYFIQDDLWHQQERRYKEVIGSLRDKRWVLLEIGVGFNTPTIIRFPFEEFSRAAKIPLVRINNKELGTYIPPHRYIPFSEPVSSVFAALKR